jgi:hypothetical protein
MATSSISIYLVLDAHLIASLYAAV